MTSTLLSVVTIIISFVAQRVFVQCLNTEYLGINGLFTNIISMLSVVELGLGSAVVYHLYKPLSTKDTPKLKSLMEFYKKGYRLIALIVLLFGSLVIPFLGRLVGNTHAVHENITFIYLFFLADVVFSYLLAYKRSILYGDQKNFIISLVHIGYVVIMNGLQIATLIITRNFYLYLGIKVAVRVLENVVLNFIVNRQYPFLLGVAAEKLDPETKKDIFIKIKALFLHKIGTFAVLGTDNIVISIFLGIKVVGLYSNYFLVINAMVVVIGQAFGATTASIGNLLVASDHHKSYEIYRKSRFVNFWLSSLATIAFLVCMDSFVTVWVGKQFVLPLGVLTALAINLYLALYRSTIATFKDSAGIYHQDRYVPIAESIVNILSSIALLHVFGLAGVFIGTICSSFLLHFFSYPKYVYIRLFQKSYGSYFREFFEYLILALAMGSLTFAISRVVSTGNVISQLAYNVFVCLTLPNLIMYLFFRNRAEFKYFKQLIGIIINTIKSKLRSQRANV